MKAQALELVFEEATEADIPALTGAMTRAFDDDSQKHLGKERGGPPGYDNGDFFRQWMLGYQESVGYKVVAEGKVVGGIIVWIFENGNNMVGTIFVDPAYQDRGVGSRTWRFIEATYPDTETWNLETPCWATKNHFFYEQKCGFAKVGTTEDSFVYKKEVPQRR